MFSIASWFHFLSWEWAQPEWFWALPLVALPWIVRILRRRRAVSFAGFQLLATKKPRNVPWLLKNGGVLLRSFTILFLVLALARPQRVNSNDHNSAEGVDIMLAVDTSGSMRARDFEIRGERPDRLEVVKTVIASFIEARPQDRIGMVVFGSEAFTQAPLTLDHDVLNRFLEHVEIGMAGDGTAIGDGVATAVKRLQQAQGKSRVVILLTDGANSAGRIDPMAAAAAAKALNVRVHTIGVGSDGIVPIVQNGRVFHIKADIDEKTLKAIADETGGIYRRAMDVDSLVNVYKEIDKLEKTKIESPKIKRGIDHYYSLVILAVVLLFIERLWLLSRFRRIPE